MGVPEDFPWHQCSLFIERQSTATYNDANDNQFVYQLDTLAAWQVRMQGSALATSAAWRISRTAR